MSNGGMIGRRNVPGVDGTSGVWSMREIADAVRAGVWPKTTGRDLFDTDSTASYTQYADASGAWAVSGGELVATGGTQSVFIRNGVSFQDGYVEADMNHAHDGGLVLRFQSNTSYYLLALSDDSGANPTNNFRGFVRSGATFTDISLLGNITWTRGTSKKIRFSISGTTLSVSVDGTQVASTTHSGITAAGGCGMRNNIAAQQSKYQSFSWAG